MRSLYLIVSLLVINCGFSFPIPGQGLAYARNESLSAVFRRVNPAVVEVAGLQDRQEKTGSSPENVLGSGVVISKEGTVLTSAHVVDAADRITVRFLDGSMAQAEIVSMAGQADLALLQLKSVPRDLTIAKLGNSDSAEVGEKIFVIGAPYGIRHTLTVGYISGRRQSRVPCRSMSPFEFLQTDAAINRGNSGGPMLDRQGRVIGIVSRILSRSGGSEGLGFAVSINTAQRLLMEEDSAWIGFDAALISGELARALNVPQEAGLLVQKVVQNSLAAAMGLESGSIQLDIGERKVLIGGDIILEIQGSPVLPTVKNFCALNDMVGGFSSESRFEMLILRNGRKVLLSNGQASE